MATKGRWRKQGTAKPKGGKGQSYKRKDNNKIKTKAKTVKGTEILAAVPKKLRLQRQLRQI
jgi:hypothetical protein